MREVQTPMRSMQTLVHPKCVEPKGYLNRGFNIA